MTAPVEAKPVRFADVVRSERLKVASLRAPWLVVLGMVAVPAALGVARGAAAVGATAAESDSAAVFEAVALGALPAAFLAALLGLLAMSSERTAGSWATTLAAVPRRRSVVLAKCLVVAGTSWAAVSGGFVLAALAGVAFTRAPITDELVHVLVGMVASGALCALGFSVLGVAAGVASRTILGGGTQLAVLLALAPAGIGLVGGGAALTSLLPAAGVQAAVTRHPATAFTLESVPVSTLPPGAGLVVVLAWAVVGLAAALVLVGRDVSAVVGSRERRRPRRPPRAGRVARSERDGGLVAVLAAEWLKLRTLPRARVVIGATILVAPLVAVLRSGRADAEALVARAGSEADLLTLVENEQTSAVLSGLGMAQLLLAVFGVWAVASEYSTRSIHATVTVVPRRLRLLTAKAVIVGVAGLAAGATAHAIAALGATLVLSESGLPATATPALAETLTRSTLVGALVALLGFAFAVIARSAVAALGVVVGVLVLSHTVLSPLQTATRGTPLVWLANLDEAFPAPVAAAQPLPPNSWFPWMLDGGVVQTNPDQALLVLAVWATVALAAAAAVFRRRAV